MQYTLVGYSGFVGSNIAEQQCISRKYNSKNIEDAFLEEHETVIYSGIRAEKYLANTYPEKDLDMIKNAIEDIKKLRFKKFILISTVDVYKTPIDVNEDSAIDIDGLCAYGRNRYYLEQWVEQNIDDYHIIRLPALFGKNIKKNFIYDMINIVPSIIKEEIYNNIINDYKELSNYYVKDNIFYKLKNISIEDKKILKDFFVNYKFNALSFTDSRNIYQFYNLTNLWNDIQFAIKNNIRLLNITTEPIKISELYKYITGQNFNNNVSSEPVKYDIYSKYAPQFNQHDKYLYLKEEILDEIKLFVLRNRL